MKHIYLLLIIALLNIFSANSQNQKPKPSRDTLIQAARDIIKSSSYCALVTVDSNGQPQVRTMNPFPMGDEIVIWFATSRTSRKVSEIKKNPKVSVYYADHSKASGYVTFNGQAVVIDDKELLVKMKRDYWNGIPDWQNKFVLIKIVPKTMDVINYEKGIGGDPETNRSPVVEF
jgi:general stress protein 26